MINNLTFTSGTNMFNKEVKKFTSFVTESSILPELPKEVKPSYISASTILPELPKIHEMKNVVKNYVYTSPFAPTQIFPKKIEASCRSNNFDFFA